jgi:hypothetical protein
MRLQKFAGFKGAVRTWTIGLVMVCVAAVAMVLAARQPSQPAKTAVVEAQAPTAAVSPAARNVSTARSVPKKTAASKASKAPAADAAPAPTSTTGATVTARATSPAAEPVSKAVEQETVAAVTVEGCLEEHDDSFRLKNTTGVEAPKSRSWKSGFLKKGSATIDVVDGSNRLKLQTHVGERISVTGLLVDREMQARSLHRLAESCD